MKYWLMKSEPDVFGIDDLKKCANKTDSWDGVRNYQARNMMRDEMKKGDLVFFYHSNCKPPGITGIMKVVKESHPDHTQFDKKSKYYDPKASEAQPRWFMVDVKYVKKFSRLIPLDELKNDNKLKTLPLVRKGNRLSIMPIEEKLWHHIVKLAENPS